MNLILIKIVIRVMVYFGVILDIEGLILGIW